MWVVSEGHGSLFFISSVCSGVCEAVRSCVLLFEAQCQLRDVKECAESSLLNPMMAVGNNGCSSWEHPGAAGVSSWSHLNDAHCRDCLCVRVCVGESERLNWFTFYMMLSLSLFPVTGTYFL